MRVQQERHLSYYNDVFINHMFAGIGKKIDSMMAKKICLVNKETFGFDNSTD